MDPNIRLRFFGLGAVTATLAGAVVWAGRDLYRAWQECKKGTPIPDDVYVNEKTAAELAEAVEPASFLTASDLSSVFKLNDAEARTVYQELMNHREGQSFSHPLFIRFSHLPIRSASQCADRKKPRETGAEESCLVVKTTRDYSDFFPNTSWAVQNLETIKNWLRSIELWNPASLISFTDCDDTLWGRAIHHIVASQLKKMGLLSWDHGVRPLMGETIDDEFKKQYPTPFEYSNYLFNSGHEDLGYLFIPMLYAGLTLREIADAYQRAKATDTFPKVYDEMRQLVNILQDRGITVGFVSASPLFLAAPMLQENGFNALLWTVEGAETYVVSDQSPDKPVKLSNLIHSQGIQTWEEVLRKFGEFRILPRPADQLTTKEGKGTAARSILERHLQVWNSRQRRVAASQVRVASVFGDHFAPFSDIRHADPVEEGSDQGLVRAGPFMPQALLLNITEVEERHGAVEISPRGKKKLDGFRRLVTQLGLSEPGVVTLSQKAIRARGLFTSVTDEDN